MAGRVKLTKKQVLEGLKSLIDDRKSFVGKDPDEIFLHDIAVLEATHRIVSSVRFRATVVPYGVEETSQTLTLRVRGTNGKE